MAILSDLSLFLSPRSHCLAALIVRFKQTAYDVNEGDGSVTICVEIEPASSESVSVFVSVASGNATEGMPGYATRGLPMRTF